MGGDSILAGNLELDDVSAASEQRKRLLAAPEESSKSAGQHNSLDIDSAELPAEKKQTVSELDFGRRFDEDNGFQTCGHKSPLVLKGAEHDIGLITKVNESSMTTRAKPHARTGLAAAFGCPQCSCGQPASLGYARE